VDAGRLDSATGSTSGRSMPRGCYTVAGPRPVGSARRHRPGASPDRDL